MSRICSAHMHNNKQRTFTQTWICTRQGANATTKQNGTHENTPLSGIVFEGQSMATVQVIMCLFSFRVLAPEITFYFKSKKGITGLFFRFWGPNSDPIFKLTQANFKANWVNFFHLTQNFGIFTQIIVIFSLTRLDFPHNSPYLASNSAKIFI